MNCMQHLQMGKVKLEAAQAAGTTFVAFHGASVAVLGSLGARLEDWWLLVGAMLVYTSTALLGPEAK